MSESKKRRAAEKKARPAAPARLLDLICLLAEVPSFSSFEERLHPLVLAAAAQMPGVVAEVVARRNVVLRVPGDEGRRPVALAAHLDKINHFDRHHSDPLVVERTEHKLCGLLDDAVGVGICLYLGLLAAREAFPPLLLLFTEMEEGTGLRQHPHLLRGAGHGLEHGVGARRLAQHLEGGRTVPPLVITVDLTPRLQGEPGIALYTDHWEHTDLSPSAALVRQTEEVAAALLELEPDIKRLNSTNDYLTYGRQLNAEADADADTDTDADTDAVQQPVVSVALEPSVWPYHQAREEVFIEDVGRVTDILVNFLKSWM